MPNQVIFTSLFEHSASFNKKETHPGNHKFNVKILSVFEHFDLKCFSL